MARIAQIPTLNNIRFVPDDILLPERYHRVPDDKEWFHLAIREWQKEERYFQPIQQSDVQYIVAHRSDFNDLYFEVYDCDGNLVVERVDPYITMGDAGSSYVDNNGNATALVVHQYRFLFSDFELDDGIYYIRMVFEYFDGVTLEETRYWYSEPLDVRAEHEDTVLIEYYNDTNKEGVVSLYQHANFIRPKFGHRVSGDVFKPEHKRANVDFQEQDYEYRNINTNTWVEETLYIGGDKGVPAYVFEKLNAALACDHKFINGREIAIVEGAEWQKNGGEESYPLYTGEIPFSDYDKQDRITDAKGAEITLIQFTSFPAAIYAVGLNNNPYVITARVINDDSEADDLSDELNATILPALGYNGVAAYDSGTNILSYQNAEGENFKPNLFNTVLYNPLILTVVASASQITTIAVTKGLGIFDWGDGDIEVYGDAFGTTAFSHTYGTSSTFTLRMFCTPATQGVTVTDYSLQFNPLPTPTAKRMVRNITGSLPTGCRVFEAQGCDFSAVTDGLDFDFFIPCRLIINTIKLIDCKMDQWNGDTWDANRSVPNGNNWQNLFVISLQGNNITQTEVEQFVNNFWDWIRHPGSLMDLRQSPPVTISNSPATTNKTKLQQMGWQILT